MLAERPPRSIAAIAAKRAWLRGEITDEALAALRANAMDSEIIQWRNAARKAAQEAKALKAKKAATSTTEAGRVGDRPYARGRSYREDRYDER